jgi:hypothetical protein
LQYFSDAMSRVHPEDLAAVNSAVEACRRGASFDMEHRVLLPDGRIRWLYGRARPLLDEYGEMVCMVGACTDVTRRKQSELEAFAALATQAPAPAAPAESVATVDARPCALEVLVVGLRVAAPAASIRFRSTIVRRRISASTPRPSSQGAARSAREGTWRSPPASRGSYRRADV